MHTKRPKKIEEVVEEIEQYQLEEKERMMFNLVKEYSEKFSFNKAIECLKLLN